MNRFAGIDTEEQLKDLLGDWVAAERRGDTVLLERTLADDFVGVGPRGFMLTKTDWLRRYSSGDLVNETFTLDDLRVRLYDDAAVVIGRETQQSTYKGTDASGQFRTTLVWVRQQGEWRLASLHLSPIAAPS